MDERCVMDWKLGSKLGEGAFGNVFLGTHQTNGTKRAIKHLKGNFSWEENIKLRELQMIIAMSRHEHIVELHQVILQGNQLYYVFEYLSDGCLDQWINEHRRSRRQTTDSHVHHILRHILLGLEHVHKHGLCHRDIKPENILQKGETWKIADFSLARRVAGTTNCSTNCPSLTTALGGKTNFPMVIEPSPWSPDQMVEESFTTYVSTRWYRAPEILLHCVKYGTPVDIYATACVAVELYNLRPLFPGRNEMDQLHQITQLLGTTTNLRKALDELSIALPAATDSGNRRPPPNFGNIVPTACPSAVDLLQHMIAIDPLKRWTCSKALQHKFLVSPVDALNTDGIAAKGQPSNYSNYSNPVPSVVAVSRLEEPPLPAVSTPLTDPFQSTCLSNQKAPPHHISPPLQLIKNNPYNKKQRTFY
ncbi:hypothetical protein ACA910_008533 [Epithemia clementina (nom. ined.)]